MMQRVGYFRRMAIDRFCRRNLACPNCGHAQSRFLDRKYLVTELRRCTACRLMFRSPTDTQFFNETFYNDGYEQGFTTDMPNDNELAHLISTGFHGSPKDYSFYISVLSRLGLSRGARLFDFGCSWGYGSWQLQQAGYDVWAAEVSRPRRSYAANKLHVRVLDNADAFATCSGFVGFFDCFFSAHVIEHVPQPNAVFDLAARLLKPGGLFVSFTPNGSDEHRAASLSWRKLWGAVHPNFIDSEFLDHSFAAAPRLVTSTKRDAGWLEGLQVPQEAAARGSLESPELLFVARRPNSGSWRQRLAA